jgi:hypothetical protein
LKRKNFQVNAMFVAATKTMNITKLAVAFDLVGRQQWLPHQEANGQSRGRCDHLIHQELELALNTIFPARN